MLKTPGQMSAPVLWFTGLSGAGKSSLAAAVGAKLQALGIDHQVIDADQVRKSLCRDLGFTDEDRRENVRRLMYVAGLLSSHGVTTLVAAISPRREMRDQARQAFPGFLEVFVDAPLQTCEERDPIGLYRRYKLGEIQNLSGVDSPYESPLEPEVHCRTDRETLAESSEKVLTAFLQCRRVATPQQE
jgi:adenylyl-sulfate kinase